MKRTKFNPRKRISEKAMAALARKEKRERKESGQWWQDSVEFDYDIELDGRYDDKVEKLFELIKRTR